MAPVTRKPSGHGPTPSGAWPSTEGRHHETRGTCASRSRSALLLAGTAAGQKIPTGTLTGSVTDGKPPLPGVTVTATSPNQQGARVGISTVNGDYILALLPPGPYTVRFELEGFQTVETTVKISGDLTSRVDAVMPRVTTVAEEVTVTGRYDTISTTATDATTYESKLIQLLPVSRDVSSYVNLTPGTVQLSGAPVLPDADRGRACRPRTST